MNDGDFFSPSKQNPFLLLTEVTLRRLRLSTFSRFAVPLFLSAPLSLLMTMPAPAQSIANVSEDENHISQDWISATRFDEEDDKQAVLCRLSGNYGKLGLWASKEGLEITSEDANWNLPEKSGGALTIQIQNHFTTEHINPNKDPGAPIQPAPFRGRLTPDFQDTFFMLSQTKERMAASITPERLLPLLDALAQGANATLRYATQTPQPLSLAGTGKAISDFRQCAFSNHFADLRPTVEEPKNILENNAEDDDETQETIKAKQSQNPYKDPFTPKSIDNPWPKTKEVQTPVIDENDDPNAPNTPNEFSEQPKSPGAPAPLTEEEQAEIDKKRAEAVQEKERLEEEVRQKQIELQEEEEAKKRADEREAKRLADIAAAKQAREARRQRDIERAKARKQSLKANAIRIQKEREAERKKALKELPPPPTKDILAAHQIQAQSVALSDEMRKAQAFMSETAQGTKNKRKKVSASLAAKQIASARRKIQTQARMEALETARGPRDVQNERAEAANISLSQAQSYLETQANSAKSKKAKKASQNLSKELQSAQTFLQAQSALQEQAPLTASQKAHAKNKLPFQTPPTFSEKIKAKPLPSAKKVTTNTQSTRGAKASKKNPALPFSDQNPTTLSKLKKDA